METLQGSERVVDQDGKRLAADGEERVADRLDPMLGDEDADGPRIDRQRTRLENGHEAGVTAQALVLLVRQPQAFAQAVAILFDEDRQRAEPAHRLGVALAGDHPFETARFGDPAQEEREKPVVGNDPNGLDGAARARGA